MQYIELKIKLRPEVMQEINKNLEKEKQDIDSFINELLMLGLSEVRKKNAIQSYIEGKITLSEACKLSGSSLIELINELLNIGVPIVAYTEDLRELVVECAKNKIRYYKLLEELGKE
ncbi:MAG: UPF0175 family protein [Saccharolobus sp.]|uniref:UPF0175 family protein n=1 Tax=Saccharolobus sp. TaxID=2100761 RepID=UPI003172ACB5